MEKIKNIYGILLLAAVGIVGCSEEKIAPLPEPVPLKMSINSTDLVMGETLEITFDVTGTDEGKTAMNEDVSIKLSATTEKGAVDQLLFEGFPTEVIMKQGETSKTVSVPVKDGLNKEHTVEISAFARGYKLENALQLLTVSDYHYSRVMIKNNADNTVKEGQSFILTASVNSKLKDALTIAITPEEGVAQYLEGLPAELVIPAGESSVESGLIKMIKSTETVADAELKLTLSTVPVASRYPLVANEIVIHRIDMHKNMDTEIRDERWLYEDADQLFVSPQNEDAVKKWGQLNYVVMKEGDPHPNSGNVLPEGKWKFFRAYEFHKIPGCLAKKDSPMGDYTSTDYPLGFADQNTGAVETQGAVDNTKYAYVMDEGYLRMMTLKERAKSGNGGKVWDFGTSAFYSCKFMRGNANSTEWPSSNIRIYPGMRIETRARMRGMENSGMLPGIWLQGNEQVGGNADWNRWPDFGEIDVMENNSRHGNLAYRRGVEQTFHFGSPIPGACTGGGAYNPTKAVTELASGGKNGTIIDEFQIYWVEWIDDETVAIGTNGVETLRVTKAMTEQNGGRWPFSYAVNDEGLYYILTMMFLHKAVPNWEATDMNMSYKAARNVLKVNPDIRIPRMEIDWVRFYIDDTYTDHGKPYRKDLILY